MSVFNLRLGVWLPSPQYIERLRQHPDDTVWIRLRRFPLLFKEVFSSYDADDRFRYVTDGGQFDNLGLYELLARRQTIFCFDARPPGSAAFRISFFFAAMIPLSVA